jgi:death-on-curing protein
VIFLLLEEVLEIHARAIEEFGGFHGLLDEGRLMAALMAPQNRYYYENVGLVGCAAAYAFHITQAHAFLDGNKRTGAAATAAFIYSNDATWDPTKEQLVDVFLKIASGELPREQVENIFGRWIVLPSEAD